MHHGGFKFMKTPALSSTLAVLVCYILRPSNKLVMSYVHVGAFV